MNNILNELTRRIPPDILIEIESELLNVNSNDISKFNQLLSEPNNLVKKDSDIYSDKFCFIAMHQFKAGKISLLNFATLMSLWGAVNEIAKEKRSYDEKSKFIPLFQDDTNKKVRNDIAVEILKSSLKINSLALPNLVDKSVEEIIEDIYQKSLSLEYAEAGFWLVEDTTKHVPGSTIRSEIVHNVDLKLFHYKYNDTVMLPSFSVMQLFLNSAFEEPVRINPVINISSVNDIKKGSLYRFRDFAIPFVKFLLPKPLMDLMLHLH